MKKHGWMAIIAAIILFGAGFRLFAEAADGEFVRVGYYEDGDYMTRSADGRYRGFNFEFLQEIAKFAGFSYEVVDGESWRRTLRMLREGEIDLLPSVYLTEERKKEMLFSDASLGSVFVTLNVRVGDSRYNYEDFASFQGMKVGIIEGGKDGEKFRSYCREHGVKLDIVPYAETGPLLEALADGTLDGVAITHLGRNSTFRSVARFSPEPLYIAVNARRPDLLARINAALDTIFLRDPNYQMKLYNKYFSVGVGQNPAFTKDEEAFLREDRVIRVAYDPSWRPLEYTDPKTGSFVGVTADLFASFTDTTGLQFRFEPVPQREALSRLSEGKIDVVCSVTGDYLWNERNNMYATRSYLRSPTVLLRGAQTGAIRRIALQDGYGLLQKIADDNPDKEILFFKTVRECVDAVLEGKADATYTNAYISSFLRFDRLYESLAITALSMYSSEICLGVSKKADPRLFSILDKCVQYTAAEKMDELVLKNTAKPRRITLYDFAAQHFIAVVCGLAALFAVIILLLLRNLVIKTRSHRRIQELLYRDDLTGLDNMNKFYKECEALLAGEPDGAYALLYGDINQFKTINDNLGFAAGDQILHAFAEILRRGLGEGELCARVSADHFILLLRYVGWDELSARVNGLNVELDEWRRMRDMTYRIATVFGVHVISKTEESDVHRMLDYANYARRNAKQTSKPIVLYGEKMREKALLQRELEDRLELALAQDEFEAYFQPKVDMRDGTLVGSEALVRWNHPVRGLLMPGSFIPFFERNGSVMEVDLYIYEQVCRTVREWLDRKLAVKPVSCNFSSLHFDSPDFPDRVTAIADRHGVPHALLELELTESAIMGNPEAVCAQVLQLKERGFLIAIDDFGSGYSSLGQLQQLMADVLKLDRSFVGRGQLGTRERIVIGSVVGLARQLGMDVICEGVENGEQAEMLIGLGCHKAQGFYYARPMRRELFEELLKKGFVA